MASEVEVDPLRVAALPPAAAGGESHADHPPAVAGGQPAFLVAAPAAHRLFLLTLGHPAFPRQAEDVGVAAHHRALLHRREHAAKPAARVPGCRAAAHQMPGRALPLRRPGVIGAGAAAWEPWSGK